MIAEEADSAFFETSGNLSTLLKLSGMANRLLWNSIECTTIFFSTSSQKVSYFTIDHLSDAWRHQVYVVFF